MLCLASCDQMRKPSAHAIFSAVFRKHDRCCLQGFPGAAARLAVTYRPVILRIYFSGVDDSSAVMTQNAGEQTLFVVFGASVSDSLDIYTGFRLVYICYRSPQFISNCGPIQALFSFVALFLLATSWSNIVHIVEDEVGFFSITSTEKSATIVDGAL